MKNNHINYSAETLNQSIPLAEDYFEQTGDRSLLDFILLNTIVDERFYQGNCNGR